MKVACVTDDGVTISPHFGRAQYYAVVTVEGDAITAREMRDKTGVRHTYHPMVVEDDGLHGTSPGSHEKHVSMAGIIDDCEALLCRGMGYGAYESMQQLGIRPIVTDVADIDTAVLAYASGQLQDHPETLH
jgi:predicted Fe-Mo cluster-binding NifX family protein